MQTKILLLGGNGLVGSSVIELISQQMDEYSVSVPTRNPMPHVDGFCNPIIDYDHLESDAGYWNSDVVICCLGTTRKKAGSVKNFIRVDHDYVIDAAQLAYQSGCRTFIYNSTLGADPKSSSLYLKTKGMVEENLKRIGFEHLILLRPGLLDNQGRQESRPLETLSVGLFRSLGGFLPKRYRLVSPKKLADNLLGCINQSNAKVTIVESDQLV